MARINVVGSSGSGKSTFARQLAACLEVPYLEMDAIYWKPDWQEPDNPEFFAKLEQAITPEAWVLDGNYTKSIPIKWQKTEIVIWLDYPFALTLYRSLSRSINRAITQRELWAGTGNRESFHRMLSRDSVVWWMITNYRKVRQKYQSLMQDPAYQHIQFIRITSPRQARALLMSDSFAQQKEDA